jgi:protein O-GlcNAc transferase
MPSEITAFGEIASHLANPLVLIGLALLLFFGVHRALIRSRILPPVDRKTSGVIIQSLLRYGFWIAALLIVLGIAYAGYKTYRETRPAIAYSETASKAIEVLAKQLQSKNLREQEYQDQIKALTETVQALARKRDAPGVKEALAALAQGQTQAAKDIFARTVEAKTAEGAAANRQAAEAARHLGTLTFLGNTGEALRWYRRAVELDPANADGWNQLGHLYHRTGQLDQAEAAYGKVIIIGEANGDTGAIAAGTGNLGVVYEAHGDLGKAEEMYQKALALHGALGSKEGIADGYGNLGNIFETRDDLVRAKEMYRKALGLHEAFGYKEGMADDYNNLGNVYRRQGETKKAEEMLQKALVLYEALGSKQGMGSAYGNLGVVYLNSGQIRKAEETYQKALGIYEALGYKEGMAKIYGNLCIIYGIRMELKKAEETCRKALAIQVVLGNKESMAIDYSNLGKVHQRRGELEKAQEMYQKALALFKEIEAASRVKQAQTRLDALNKSSTER